MSTRPALPPSGETAGLRGDGQDERSPRSDGRDPSGGDGATLRLRAGIRRLLSTSEGDQVVKPAPPVPVREIFRTFWPYARPYRPWIAVGVVLMVLAPVIQAAKLYMIKVIVDEVLVPHDVGPLAWIAPALVGLTVAGGAVSFCDGYIARWVGQRFLLSLRTSFFRHLQSLSLDFFDRRRVGDLVSRLTGGITAIENFVVSGVAAAISSLVTLVVFAGALFYLQWQLALVALLGAPILLVLVRVLSRFIKQAAREKHRRTGAMSAIAEESLSNVALVQSYNRQEMEIERVHRENRGIFEADMVVSRLKNLLTPLLDLVQTVTGLVIIGLGAWALAEDRISLGSLLVFIAYLNQLYATLRGLSRLSNTMHGASASAERIIECFKAEPTVKDRPGAVALPSARGSVEFDGVSFRYLGGSRPAVSDVSLRVEPGQTLALVGRSGAGKSTLAKLLLRFYDPGAGAVRLDGLDLRDLELRSLRNNVALLMQETLIFEGSVAENIAYGRPGATDEEIVRAAEAADAHEFIEELSDGYHTLVGQHGRRLSGGQRQRIAIARALIRDAPVLILDEPTASIDAEAGARILDPLRQLMRGRTTIVISHNLLTVHDADCIVVLEEGRITARGRHDELIRQDGTYARLWRMRDREPTPT
jgi:ABC-type multidrug transport system fused ATPase/permease subunit